MGFASYYEDILDSRDETDKKTSHYNGSQGTRKATSVSKSQRTQRIGSMKSQFKLRRSADSTRTPKSSRRKTARPKPPQREKSRPKSSRRKKSRPKPPQREKSRPKSSRRKTARRKTATDARQHIRREEPLKIQPVTTDEIQQRIQREIIRQRQKDTDRQ